MWDLVYATNHDKRHSVRLGEDRGSGWVGVEEDPNVEIEGNEDISPMSNTRDDGEYKDDGGVGSMADTMDPLGSSGMPCRPISDLPIGMLSGGGGDYMHMYEKVKSCIFVKPIYLAKVGIWNESITLLRYMTGRQIGKPHDSAHHDCICEMYYIG